MRTSTNLDSLALGAAFFVLVASPSFASECTPFFQSAERYAQAVTDRSIEVFSAQHAIAGFDADYIADCSVDGLGRWFAESSASTSSSVTEIIMSDPVTLAELNYYAGALNSIIGDDSIKAVAVGERLADNPGSILALSVGAVMPEPTTRFNSTLVLGDTVQRDMACAPMLMAATDEVAAADSEFLVRGRANLLAVSRVAAQKRVLSNDGEEALLGSFHVLSSSVGDKLDPLRTPNTYNSLSIIERELGQENAANIYSYSLDNSLCADFFGFFAANISDFPLGKQLPKVMPPDSSASIDQK